MKRGRAAVQANLAQVISMDVSTLGLKDLELMCVYAFLLPDAEQIQVAALTGQVCKAAANATDALEKTTTSSRSSKGKPT